MAERHGEAGDGEEVLGGVVVSGGDPTEILQAVEHAPDRISAAIESRREAGLAASIGPGGRLEAAPGASIFCARPHYHSR